LQKKSKYNHNAKARQQGRNQKPLKESKEQAEDKRNKLKKRQYTQQVGTTK
jgi:hypothetical protein